MEPMIEIFLEETASLMVEFEEVVFTDKEEFESSDVNQIFRVVHTIKADAAMMMIENISDLARTLERVLYFVRDENKTKLNNERFRGILEECIDFIKCELDKIGSGYIPNGDNTVLIEKVTKYLDFLSNKQDLEPIEEIVEPIYYISSTEPVEQVQEKKYYCATARFVEDNIEICEKANQLVNIINLVYDSNCSYFPNTKEKELASDIIEKEGFKIIFGAESSIQDIEDIIMDPELLVLLELELIESYEEMSRLVRHYKMRFDFEQQKINRDKNSSIFIELNQLYTQVSMIIDDMNKNLDRSVVLVSSGGDIQLEKLVFEKLSSSIVHIIRNAMDHGIENREERIRANKDINGTISIESEEIDEAVRITISDDGAGLNKEYIQKKAIEKNMISENAVLSDKEIYSLIIQPGFTTKETATDYSGRGVGLDVVNVNIQKIGGLLEIRSKSGLGTTFNIIVPKKL